jgi:Uma2 family endonuclease
LPGGKVVGVDVAYVPASLTQVELDDSTLIVGAPTLVAEVLSPSDTNETIREKLKAYLNAMIPIVWKLDPDDRTVTVYRPGQPPVLFNDTQELKAEPELPGFRVRVADLFGR